jgi:hypothetical protein
MPHVDRALALLWLCFVVRGVYYASAIPLWEGYDEYSHYAYVEYLVQNGRIPVPGVSRNSYEVESSLRAYPLPWTQQRLRPGVISYERWGALSPAERGQRLAAIMPSHAEDLAGGAIYESQQPPLYYWTMAPALAVSEWLGASLAARVFALRCASILLCSLALPIGWALAKRVLGSDAAAAGVVAVAVCMPEFLIDVARVGNESMAVLAGTALCYGCVLVLGGRRDWEIALATGAALGACLLTKAYFLSAIPATCAVFFLARNRKLAAVLPVAMAISAWWYRFIYQATGDPTGMIQSVALRHVPLGAKLDAALHLNWLRGIDVALFSHLWFGGWSFLELRSWMYHVFYVVFFVGLIGLAVAAVRGRWRPLAAPALIEAGFCSAIAYHVVLGQIGYGVPVTSGWYFYCLVFAELVLLAAGLREVVPRRFGGWILPALAGMFALLDVYGLSCVQIPYYTGITAHLLNGRLPALRLSQVTELASRAGGWWVVYAAATVGAVLGSIPRPTVSRRAASVE